MSTNGPSKGKPVKRERHGEEDVRKKRRERKAAHSSIQALQLPNMMPGGPTLGERLMRLNAKAATHTDVADLLELYFALFHDLDPDGFWAVHLLSKRHVVLQRATSRIPQSEPLQVTRRAWAEAGLDEETVHSEILLVDQYRPVQREGFQAVLVGARVHGVISYEPSNESETDRNEVQLIAATLAPHIAQFDRSRDQAPIGDYLSHLIRNADIPLLLIDGSKHVVVTSEAFRRLIGKKRVSSRPWFELVAPRDRECVALATLSGTSVECDLVGDPSNVRVALQFIPLIHPALRGTATLIIGRDLTTLRNLERQVIQAEKLATLGQLAAGVVHELNNPLTSILAYSEYMHDAAEKRARPEKEVAALKRIVESSERMRRFTQSLVAYARPSAGPPARVDVTGLIDESLGFCEHLIRNLDTRVQVDLPADFPGARGVRASLQQVLINLITNACHAATEEGQLRIAASIQDELVCIRVTDNGPGVPSALRNKIFEPFFSTKAEGDGTGLGLSIVRNILSLQLGSIHLDETYEGGACFVVRLPIWAGDESSNKRG